MHAGGPLSRKGFRDATTRPSSLGSDGSSMAISADQTEGTRMQRRAKAAMRKAMSMTSITREGRGEGGTEDGGSRERTRERMNFGPSRQRQQLYAEDQYYIIMSTVALWLIDFLLALYNSTTGCDCDTTVPHPRILPCRHCSALGFEG